jgi:hypothetical protein
MPRHTQLLMSFCLSFIEPMLLLRTNELPDGPDWLY